jgi:hypothetical protein
MDFSLFSPQDDLRSDVVYGSQEFAYPSLARETLALVNFFDGLVKRPTIETTGNFTNGLILESLPIGGMALLTFAL